MDREAGYFFTIPLPMVTPIRAATIHRSPAEEVLTAKMANCDEFAEKLPDK